MIETLLYLTTGIFAGLASGLLGVGGGLIIVPVLFFIFSTQNLPAEHIMHMALATSLATIIITSISSARAHHKKQAVLWPIFLLLAPGICVGAWLGGIAASEIETSILKPGFGIFEIFVALYLLWNHQGQHHAVSLDKIKSAAGGFIIGGISAIVGIGGGTLTVPFLNWHNIPMRNAVATSAACGLPIAIFGAASYIYTGWSINNLPGHTLGYVHLPAFALIIVTSFLFAPVGAKLAHRLSENTLKKWFAIFLMLIGLKMIFF
jgi:uncharacterized membrane protein YfcA